MHTLLLAGSSLLALSASAATAAAMPVSFDYTTGGQPMGGHLTVAQNCTLSRRANEIGAFHKRRDTVGEVGGSSVHGAV